MPESTSQTPEAQIVALFHQLPPVKQQQVLTLVKMFHDEQREQREQK